MEINYSHCLISWSNSCLVPTHRSSSQSHKRAGHPYTACRDRTQTPQLPQYTITHMQTHKGHQAHSTLFPSLAKKQPRRTRSLALRQNRVSPQGHSISLQQSKWLRLTRRSTNIANARYETDASQSTLTQAR